MIDKFLELADIPQQHEPVNYYKSKTEQIGQMIADD